MSLIQIELMEGDGLSPKMPEHAGGVSQHENVGLDFYAAAEVSWEEIGAIRDMPPFLSIATAGEVDQETLTSLEQALQETEPVILASSYPDTEVKVKFHSDAAVRVYKATARTGVRMGLPTGYHMRLASRSGLWFKNNILAFPGTVDSSYTGEILVGLLHFSVGAPVPLPQHSKVAQGIIFRSEDYEIRRVDKLDRASDRGANGFGSTGV